MTTETTQEINLEALFDQCIEQGMDKNQTIIALATDGNMDVTRAVREYNNLARDKGLMLSVKDRTVQINEALAEYPTEAFTDREQRKDMLDTLQSDFDISYPTAYTYVRKWCETNEIELPSASRNTSEDMVNFVKQGIDDGKSRTEIVDGLQDAMGYTKNSANSAYSRATRELGISNGGGQKASLESVVTFIRENEHLPRKEAVAAMCEELGYAESTANSFFIYLNFAKEYSRQEQDEIASEVE